MPKLCQHSAVLHLRAIVSTCWGNGMGMVFCVASQLDYEEGTIPSQIAHGGGGSNAVSAMLRWGDKKVQQNF